jgi:HAD superfamily hydrolase (TIGR01662 family)
MPEALVERGIRCLLFDLGDTLWYRESQDGWDQREGAANQRATDLLRQHINPSWLPKLDDHALGHCLRQAFDAQVRTTIRHTPLLEPDAVQAIACVLRTWGSTQVDLTLCSALFEALRVRIPNSRPLFADALPTLTELRRRGYLLGIVTNRLWGGQAFHEDLRSIGLLDYFNLKHIAISGDLGLRKPNPQIFEHALNALHVSPQETAMIGDSLSADILGAQPLGIYAIWKPKPWLSKWAKEHATAQPSQASETHQPISAWAFPGEDTADTQLAETLETPAAPPSGVYVTDDDYILAHANTSRDYLEQFRQGEIRPDRVIEHLSELLDIFPEVSMP